VVVAVTHAKHESLIGALMRCRYVGVHVVDAVTLFETLCQRVSIDHISQEWVALSSGFIALPAQFYAKIKRLTDIVMGAIGLVLAAPVIALAGVAVRLESRGPAIYSQRRVGLHGYVFTVYKLRSMRDDAENGSAQWATENDPRMTRVGRVLRKLRIDELPQFWNVLSGEMTLVGPRPERPEFVDQLTAQVPFYNLRHMVKPGITGWAQVMFPYGASVEESARKLEYDLYYVRHMSLWLDLRIAARTLHVLLAGKGSR